MEKSEKDILSEIVIDHHENEFRILENGDDAGAHFSLYLPTGSDTKTIQTKILEAKLKKRVIIITTPVGYIGSILR